MKRLFLVVATAALVSGCFVSPDVRFVKAADKTYKAIAPEYSRYVEQDAGLSKDQKADRKFLLKSWRKRIDEAQKGGK